MCVKYLTIVSGIQNWVFFSHSPPSVGSLLVFVLSLGHNMLLFYPGHWCLVPGGGQVMWWRPPLTVDLVLFVLLSLVVTVVTVWGEVLTDNKQHRSVSAISQSVWCTGTCVRCQPVNPGQCRNCGLEDSYWFDPVRTVHNWQWQAGCMWLTYPLSIQTYCLNCSTTQ